MSNNYCHPFMIQDTSTSNKAWDLLQNAFKLKWSKHKKVQKNAYLLWHGHTVCKFWSFLCLDLVLKCQQSFCFRFLVALMLWTSAVWTVIVLSAIHRDNVTDRGVFLKIIAATDLCCSSLTRLEFRVLVKMVV